MAFVLCQSFYAARTFPWRLRRDAIHTVSIACTTEYMAEPQLTLSMRENPPFEIACCRANPIEHLARSSTYPSA
jgi:hypothetical protein